MKALIPAAGLGTRYLPLTKAVPKELIHVGKFPVLHHVVQEAKDAGCTEIGIILSAGKEAIRQYFSWDQPLMDWLDSTGKREAMAEWEALTDGLTFTWINQPEQRGLGDAIACGEDFADGEGIVVLLGDTIMQGGSPLPQMVKLFEETKMSQVAVESVTPEKATRYGVCGGALQKDGSFSLDAMIEKPAPGEVPVIRGAFGATLPDAFAFAARYVLSNSIFNALKTVPPGRNNEIQLTDAMAAVMKQSGFSAIRIPGKRKDVGAPE
ncbi:UTP--glucose-1-phosphate uridylyltransferase [Puniceicoccales bacterium CK1056]|uniref:UTP--glucose-1-phosphate uridylyltransferase n=1 Tax=Oceanipulchritudo coccoides TaxID=2706888 RepID=A0A6B2M3Q9_9BACT|nr:UTP--glucose-1-phosphate uridylyltransferase [Oceanipulchritudo coccoides]NDV63056.1 UTP--glucose-1-phosphate uridylyltransferase [Oceanipulchritudo coccoides]